MLFVVYRVIISTMRSLAYVGAIYFGALQVLHGGVAGAVRAVFSLGVFQGALWIFGSDERADAQPDSNVGHAPGCRRGGFTRVRDDGETARGKSS